MVIEDIQKRMHFEGCLKGNSGFGILPKDTLACKLGESGIDPPVDDLLYHLNHSCLNVTWMLGVFDNASFVFWEFFSDGPNN